MKTFTSQNCYEFHKLKICKMFMKCQDCQKHFRKSNGHHCGYFFCRICYSFHQKNNKTCFVRPNNGFKKCTSRTFFLDIKRKEDKIIYISFVDIQTTALHFSYPNMLPSDLNFQTVKCVRPQLKEKPMEIFVIFLMELFSNECKFNIITDMDIIYLMKEQLKDFDQKQILFKDTQQFVSMSFLDISRKLNINPFMSILPIIIEENWYKQDLYEFDEKDFTLSLFGNFQEDLDILKISLEHLKKFIDNKDFTSEFLFLNHILKILFFQLCFLHFVFIILF